MSATLLDGNEGRRRRRLRGALISLCVALALVQLVPVTRTNPPVVADVGTPADLAAVLRRACYDCHSNETTWPSYSAVAPVSWLIGHDVREGRHELNFSSWSAYDPAVRQKRSSRDVPVGAVRFLPPVGVATWRTEGRGCKPICKRAHWDSPRSDGTRPHQCRSTSR
jgi:hypothetical protein